MYSKNENFFDTSPLISLIHLVQQAKEQQILHLPPHSSHSSRPIRKRTPQQQRMEAEGNADEGNEDEGNADKGNVEMYLLEPFHTSPLICLIHLVQYAK